MRKSLLTTMILLAAFSVSFAKNIEDDAVYKSIYKSYTLNADGSTDYRERKELEVITNMAFDYFGETFIDYNPDFQKLTINEAYVIRKDGTKVETPQNAFNPMLPSSCTGCERLNAIRTMVVTHTALENNATIVLDYTIHSDNFFFSGLFETVSLCESAPVEKYTISVSVPEDRPLNWDVNFGSVQNSRQQFSKENMKTVVWEFASLPAKSSELYLFRSAQPAMSFYSADFAEDFINTFTQQAAFNMSGHKEIKDFFVKLTDGVSSNRDRIIAVRDYISTNISTKNANQKLLNRLLATPEHVWTTNCALPIEKEILLSRALRELGYDAWVVFDDRKLSGNNCALVCATVGLDTLYISAAEADELDMRATLAPTTLIFENGRIQRIGSIATEIEVVADIKFPNGNVKEPRTAVLTKKIKSPLTKTLSRQDTVVARPRVSEAGGLYVIEIDNGKYGTQVSSVEIYRDRKTDINTRESAERYVYNIEIPEGYEAITKPFREEIEVEGAKLLEEVNVAGRKVSITRVLELPKNGVSGKSARKFKEMMGRWETPKRIVIRKSL